MSRKNHVRLAWLRHLPCCARNLSECSGPIETHHPKGLEYGCGMGLKSSDEDAVPMCQGHHTPQWHAALGCFKGWRKKRRKEWQRQMVELYHRAWEVQQNIALPIVTVREGDVF